MAIKSRATEEQLAAILHRSGDALVSASAGSGKTFVMIQSLIGLITEGHTDIENVLAVTFTNLAAAEMKEKLLTAVADRINDPDTSIEDQARLKEQLGKIPCAAISTFHSFCNDLIKSYFYELGLDASFKIAEEAQCSVLKKRAVDELFEELYSAPTDGFINALEVFVKRHSDEPLKQTVRELSKQFSAEAYPERAYERALELYGDEGYERIKVAFFAYYQRFFGELARELDAVGQELAAVGADKCALHVLTLKSYCEQLIGAEGFMQMVSLCHGAEGDTLPRLLAKGDENIIRINERRKYLKEKYVKEIKYLLDTFGTRTDGQLRAEVSSAGRVAEGLIELCRAFDKKYAEIKREENVVDFSDLEHFALEILDKPEICEAVRSRYEYIFADEYQDTNGVQEEILSRINRKNAFMVGDVKQSIYGFRGCNPNIFENKKKRFLSGEGRALKLSANFRSGSNILKAVNNIFNVIMTEETCGTDYSSAPMTGGNGEEGLAEMHVCLKPERTKNADCCEKKGVYSVKANLDAVAEEEFFGEGAVIARLICDNVGRPIVKADGEEQLVRYSDVVILCRSIKSKFVTSLIRTLGENDIPVSCEVARNITVYPEILHLISLLRVIDCARQDIPLCSLMRGPIGGFSDKELAEIRRFSFTSSDGKTVPDFYSSAQLYMNESDDELGKKLREFFEYIERTRFISDFCSCGELLARVVRERELDLVYGARANGGARVKRISSFISKCGAGEAPPSVKDVLAKIDGDEKWLEVAEGGSDDAVKIMTVHASKGLEFPVVIVCGLAERFNETATKGEVMFTRDCGIDGRPCISVKSYDLNLRAKSTNLICEYVKRRYRSEAAKENMRLLYVALTRAKSRLYLTLTANSVPESVSGFDLFTAISYEKYIPQNAMPVTFYDRDGLMEMQEERSPTHLIAGETDELLKQRIIKNLTFIYPYDTTAKAKTSVTEALTSFRSDEPLPPVEEMFSEYAEGGARLPSGHARAVGNAYHRFMELVDFNRCTLVELKEQLQELLHSGLITTEECGLVDIDKIHSALSDGFFHVEGAEYFRELPFEVLVPAGMLSGGDSSEQVLVQGVIDVIAFTKGGEILVADYKVSKKGKELLKQTYQKQVELYSYAAEVITGKRVASKTLFNLLRGEKVEI